MRPILTAILVSAAALTASPCVNGQNPESTGQAEFAADVAIFVSSDAGKLMKMADGGHCVATVFAQDQQTVGCSVARGSANAEELMQSQRVEIYLRNGRRSVIETNGPITDWHFWEGGRQIAVTFRVGDNVEHHALYDATTGKILQETGDPTDLSRLPQWAKSPGQVQDEAVPEEEEYDRARTAWIAKCLRLIATVKPGLSREALTKVFRTEGGLSTRFQRTYVYLECPFIKVNVRFKAVRDEQDGLNESPDDVIVSISQPYLAWSVAD